MSGDRTVSRRTVLATLGASVTGIAGTTPAVAEAGDEHELLADEDGSITHRERLALADETADDNGLEVGDQLRVECESCTDTLGYGIATIGHKLDEEGVVGMETPAVRRLQFIEDDETIEDVEGETVSLLPYGPHPSYDTRSEAQEHDEFVETLEDDGDTAELAITAPHGTYIEPDTEKQADRVYERIEVDAVSWTCVGHSAGGGAFDRWHVTSTDISRDSFPKLDQIADHGFDHAVSFHGFAGWDCFSEDIVVGGAAPKSLKEQVKDGIETRTEFAVLITGVEGEENTNHDCESEPFPGRSSENFVNWLTADGASGLQIEQSPAVRDDGNRDQIADVVVDVYEDVI